MSENSSVKCPYCKGSGHAKLSKSSLRCLATIRKLKQPTISELHEASEPWLLATATHKRVVRLERAGLVRTVGKYPMRVELV